MKKVITLFLFLVLSFIISQSYAQEVTFHAFPDKHFTDIVGIDIDDNADNAITISLAGKTIFWDLESEKALRIWEYERMAFATKMIFNNSVGMSAFLIDEKRVDFVLYDLFEGIAYDTLSVDVPSGEELIAYAIGEKSEKQQEFAMLFSSKIVTVDFLRRRIKDEIVVDRQINNISYVGSQLVATGLEKVYTVDLDKQILLEHPATNEPSFKIDQILDKYSIKEDNGSIIVAELSSFGKTYSFKNTINLNPKHIARIVEGLNSILLVLDFENYTQFVQVDSKSNTILWHKKILSPMADRAVYDIAYAKKKSLYVYTDYAKSIKFISCSTGEDVSEIVNELPRTRLTYLSPDLRHMVYTDMPAAANGGITDPNPAASYYLDMSFPGEPYFLFEGVINKIEFTNSGNFLVLKDSGIGGVEVATGTYYDLEYPNPPGHDLAISDMSYDSVSHNLLIYYEQGKISPTSTSNSPTKDVPFPFVPLNSNVKQELKDMAGTTSALVIRLDDGYVLKAMTFGNESKNVKLIPGGRYMYSENKNKTNPQLYDYVDNKFVKPAYNKQLTNIVIDKFGTYSVFRYADNQCIEADLLPKFKTDRKFEIDALPVMMVVNPTYDQVIFRKYKVDDKLFAYSIERDEIDDMSEVYCNSYQDITNDGKFLALMSRKAVQIVNLDDGSHVSTEIESFEASPSFINFANDRNMAISGRYSGRLNIWNLDTKAMTGTILLNQNGKYVNYNKYGLFDCSPDAMNDIYYSIRKEIVGLDQLKDEFWMPGLMEYTLSNDNSMAEELGDGSEILQIPLYPDVNLSTSTMQDTLIVTLSPNQGGIGQVSFFINNVEVDEEINGARTETIRVPLSKYEDYLVPNRPNILGVVVYNQGAVEGEEGWLKSRQKRLPIEYKKRLLDPAYSSTKGLADKIKKAQAQMLDPEKTRLVALIVGSTDYQGSEIDLRYADNDANSMEDALRKTSKLLFKEDNKVIIHKLISRASDLEKKSTRANIVSKMEEIQKDIKVDDILVLFFSGHGVTKDGAFYYLTMDASASAMTDSKEELMKVTIPASEINEFLKKTKSLRKLLILDACYSGSVMTAFTKSVTNSSATQRKAMDMLKDKTGVYVLSSSLSEQESVELDVLHQGIMTYSLLDGMSGRAAVDSVLQVTNLINHVIQNVPKLAKRKGHKQQPVFISPEASMPFAIGLSDKSVSPTGSKFPIGSASVVDTMFTDNLNINFAIDEILKSASNQDSKTPYEYNDLETSNNYKIKGMYKQIDGQIQLRASLINQNTLIGVIQIKEPTKEQVAKALEQKLRLLFDKINI